MHKNISITPIVVFLAVNTVIGGVIQLLSLDFSFSVVIFVSSILLFLLRKHISSISQKISSLILIVVLVACIAQSFILFNNNKRLPVLSSGWDSATHMRMALEYESSSSALSALYPVGFYHNLATFIKPLDILQDSTSALVFKTNILSLFTITIFVLISLTFYEIVLLLLKDKTTFQEQLLLTFFTIFILSGEILTPILVQGHYAQLLSYLFLLTLVKIILLRIQDKISVTSAVILSAIMIAAFGNAYVYFLPYLFVPVIYLLFDSDFKMSRSLKWIIVSLGTLISATLTLQYISSYLTNELNIVSFVLSVGGGVEQLHNHSVILLVLLVALMIINFLKKRDKSINFLVSLTTTVLLFSFAIYAYQMNLNDALSYSYYKSLFSSYIFMAILAGTGLIYFSRYLSTISLGSKLRKEDITHLLTIMMSIMFIFIGSQKIQHLSKGQFRFLSKNEYNSILVARDLYKNQNVVFLPVMGIEQTHWSEVYLEKLHPILQTSLSAQGNLMGIIADIKTDSDYIVIIDPSLDVQNDCSLELISMVNSNKQLILYPPYDESQNRAYCEKRTSIPNYLK